MDLKDKQARVNKNAAELDKEIDTFVSSFKQFIHSAMDEVLFEAKLGNKDPALALSGIVQGVYDRGLKDEISDIAKIYGSQLRRIAAEVRADGLEYQAVDIDTVEGLIKFRAQDIENKAVEVIGSLRPLVLEAIVLDTTPDFDAMRDRLDSRLVSYAKTELDTAIASFDRTVTVQQGMKAGVERYIYIGPNDKITRAFCRDVLTRRSPPIYTLDEIKGMDNGQGLDPLQAGGGYNCRHLWSPVPDGAKID